MHKPRQGLKNDIGDTQKIEENTQKRKQGTFRR